MMSTDSRIKRFDAAFLQDFYVGEDPQQQAVDEIQEIIEEQAPEAAVSYSEEALEEAKKMAYQAGMQQGFQDGKIEGQGEKAAQDQAILQALQLASSKLESFKELYDTSLKVTTAHANLLALGIVKKFLSSELAQQAETMLSDFITQHVAEVMHQPAITITLHPDLKEAFEAHIQPSIEQAGFKGDIHMISSDTLGMNDILLAWDYGKIEQNMTQALANIDKLVQEFTDHIMSQNTTPPTPRPKAAAQPVKSSDQEATEQADTIVANNTNNEGADNVGD